MPTDLPRTKSGLWIARSFNVLKHRKREKTVTLPNGKRAKVTWDDSGTVKHTETDEQLDCLVRPRSVKLALRRIDGD